MARNKVMTLWTTVVTAFLALFTALGLITTSAAAAVPRTETARNSESTPQRTAAPAPAPGPGHGPGPCPPR
ncbi:Secreted protein OS=Streptomyces fumanus OX=67302 GN=GCM10018772_12410 PE=4 SV=1 [Streptomyces fumanus]